MKKDIKHTKDKAGVRNQDLREIGDFTPETAHGRLADELSREMSHSSATRGLGLAEMRNDDTPLGPDHSLRENYRHLSSEDVSIGSRDAGDEGVAGGLAAGGEMGEGGRGSKLDTHMVETENARFQKEQESWTAGRSGHKKEKRD